MENTDHGRHRKKKTYQEAHVTFKVCLKVSGILDMELYE